MIIYYPSPHSLRGGERLGREGRRENWGDHNIIENLKCKLGLDASSNYLPNILRESLRARVLALLCAIRGSNVQEGFITWIYFYSTVFVLSVIWWCFLPALFIALVFSLTFLPLNSALNSAHLLETFQCFLLKPSNNKVMIWYSYDELMIKSSSYYLCTHCNKEQS